MNKTHHRMLLGVLLFFAFVVRIYHLSYPIADWHSWRQADTSAVSRNFIKMGFDVLHPRFDDLSNVPSGIDNPEGYRFVEFPLYNLFQAGLFKFIGVLTIEEWGRLVTILSSLITLLFTYLLLKKYACSEVGLLAVFFGAFLPYNIYYSRVILPDPMMVMAIMGGIYFFDRWREEKKSQARKLSIIFFILSLVFTTSSLLLKPYAIFFTLPLIFLAWKSWGMKLFRQWPLYVYAGLSIVPLILWRSWMVQYPEGIPANDWLLNGNGIRFRPAFFRWMIYERLIKLISGYFGVIILAFGGLSLLRIKHKGLFLSFLLSSVLYVTIFATGNVQHDYYQILIMPTLGIFYGLGGYYLLRSFPVGKSYYLGPLILLLLTGMTLYYGWNQVKGYYYINKPEIVDAGRITDRLTPPDAKVIALYDGDTSFLYQTNRQGWASYQHPLPEMVDKGATHLVQVNPTIGDVTFFTTNYEIIASSSSYILVKLKKL